MLDGVVYVVPHKTNGDFKIGIARVEKIRSRLATIERKCGELDYERGIFLFIPTYEELELFLLRATRLSPPKCAYAEAPTEWRCMDCFDRVVRELEVKPDLYRGTPEEINVCFLRDISSWRKQQVNKKPESLNHPKSSTPPAIASLLMKPAFCTPLVSENIGLLHRQLINALIHHASTHKAQENGGYSAPLKAIKNIVSYKSRNTAYLRKCLEYLEGVEISPLAFGHTRLQLKNPLRIFDAIVVTSNQVDYFFSKQMAMLQVKATTRIPVDMGLFVNFKTKSAQCLYELWLRWESQGYTPWLPLADIMRLTGDWNTNYLREFKYYKAFVMKKGCNELQEAIGYPLTIDYLHEGRRVTHVRLVKSV